MKCEDWTALVDLYLEGELPETLAHSMERHLMQCAGCAFEVRTLERTLDLLHESVPKIETPPAVIERMEARLHKRLAPHLKSPTPSGGQRALRLV